MQKYVSNELTHFVGRSLPDDEARYALLLKIFRSGVLLDPRYLASRDTPIFYFDVTGSNGEIVRRQNYYPEPYFEVRVNGPVHANEFVMPEMVCFCDIPVEDLEIHTSKYSRFGLAFSKRFLVTRGANPVYYVASSAATPLRLISQGGVHPDFFQRDEEHGLLSAGQPRVEFLEALKSRLFELIERYSNALQQRFEVYKRGKDDPNEARAQLLALVEFMMGTFCYVHGLTKVFDPDLADSDPINFYMEREWRVIGKVEFSAAEVSRVLLPKGFAERFRRDEPTFAGEITELKGFGLSNAE